MRDKILKLPTKIFSDANSQPLIFKCFKKKNDLQVTLLQCKVFNQTRLLKTFKTVLGDSKRAP